MKKQSVFWTLVSLWCLMAVGCDALLEGLYCGKDNCYDILECTRESTRIEISRKYRQLAKQHHPDKHRDPEAKSSAETKFKLLATAYEILKDEESRTDYDYMLDNPEEVYRHYYRYYRHRMAPKVDVRLVIVVTITVISGIQYFSAQQKHESAIRYLLTQPKYRNRALEMAKTQGIFDDNPKKAKKKSKAEIKEETEQVIRKVLEENMDIRGRPTIKDILWIQLILLPYTIGAYFVWQAKWIWKFNIKKEEYGEEEKLYIIRRFMKLGALQFDSLLLDNKDEFLSKELWIKPHFDEWKAEKEEELKRRMAENAKYKAYRRYLKTHGEGRITFDDS